MSATETKAISIERIFNLPLATVWKAFSEPESFKKWYGPKGYTCPECTIDFKVAGEYLVCMKGPDEKRIWSTGTYKEIVPDKKIVYTDSFADYEGNIVPASYYKMPGKWAMELLVTLEFEEVDGKTNLKMQQAGLPAEMSDECMEGWQSCFDKLETNLK